MVTHKLNFPLLDGMQAKPASEITNYFRNFDGDCYILHKAAHANAKSIISLLGSAIKGGAEIEIRIDSENAEQDMADFLVFLDELATIYNV